MRILKLTLILCVLVVPSLTVGEHLYLRDGSAIKGNVIRFAQDTLYFRTSFGSEIRVPRRQISRIDFQDSLSVLPLRPGSGIGSTPDHGAPGLGEFSSAAPGTLVVDFDGFTLSSTIAMHRDRDRDAHEFENGIETILTINGKEVFAVMDSTIDKVIKKGTETLLRNKTKPGQITVPLEAGVHQISLIIANTRVERYADRFDGKPLEKTLRLDGVVIRPMKTTRLHVGLKKKKFGLAGKELVVFER